MNLILQAIKALFRGLEAKIPKKLSDLVNDLKFPTPDWNENDPKAEGYIKNRPFYEEFTEITWVDEQTINVDESGSATLTNNSDIWPSVGSKYEVVFDGVSYTGNVWEDGDVSLRTDFTTNNGVSVQICDGRTFASSPDLAGEHTIKITYTKVTAHTIDSKFLSPDVAFLDSNQLLNYVRNNAPVRSVNGYTGAVKLTASTVGALAEADVSDWAKAKTKPSYTAQEVGALSAIDPTGTGSLLMNAKTDLPIGVDAFSVGSQNVVNYRAMSAIGEYCSQDGVRYVEVVEEPRAYSIKKSLYFYTCEIIKFNPYAETISGVFQARFTQGLSPAPGVCFTVSQSTGNGYDEILSVDSEDDSQYIVTAIKHKPVSAKSCRGKYLHVAGNGISDTERSNAHTLDWDGVPWYQGRPQFGGNAQDDGSQTVMANGDKELILTSSTEGSTKKFKITVDDSGVLTATEITT